MDIIQIADALAAKLITGTFSYSFTPVRTVFPNFELKELAALKVTVVPRSVDSSVVTRVSEQDDYSIDIGIQKKLTADYETETVALISFVTEIKDFLKLKHLTMTTRVAIWINTKIDPIYSREHLAGDNVFTSVITVTYRMVG